MILEHRSQNKVLLLIIAGIILLGGIFFVLRENISTENGEDQGPVACTLEAKICPDGSAVGRTGPNCEFAPCPGSNIPTEWREATTTEEGITFRYPEDLGTTYVHTVDWPPLLQVTEGPLTCTEAGTENARAGRTERRMVGDRTYCVTEVTGAAAGSIYTQYAYAFAYREMVPILTFSLRFVQCANYDESERMLCEKERTDLDIDAIIDRIAQSLASS